MRALRITGQAIVHATFRSGDFHFYALTACGLQVYWKTALDETVNLDVVDSLMTAEPVDAPVDCMTCLVNDARAQDATDSIAH